MVEVRVSYRIQRVGLVDTTGELLCNFALSIYDAQFPNASGFPPQARESQYVYTVELMRRWVAQRTGQS